MGASSYLTRKPWGPQARDRLKQKGARLRTRRSLRLDSDRLQESRICRAQLTSSALVRRKTSKPLRRHRRVHETRKSIPHVFQGRFALDVHIRSVLL